MSELTQMGATELGVLVDKRELSASEILEAHLKQIESVNPKINAITDLQADKAREQAEAIDRKPGDGLIYKRSLTGVPMTVKSSIAAKGFRYECGTRLRTGEVADRDASLVSNLRQSGAIILGTTNVPEFLMAYETDNALYGRTNSPLDPAFTPGGSSGGCSAAVASGCSAGSFGSDAGGSVRVPAHFCGLYGLKPTPGMIPRDGHWPPVGGPSTILAGLGPIARTAADLQEMFEVTMFSNFDEGGTDICTLPNHESVPWHYIDILRDCMIGWFDHAWNTPVTAETRNAVQNAVRALQDRGFKTERIELPELEEAPTVWWQLFGICLKSLIEDSVPSDYEMHPLSYDAMATDAEEAGFGRLDLLKAWIAQDKMRLKMLQRMQRYPFLLCPVASVPAFRHGQREWSIEGQTVRYPDVFVYSQVFNVLGFPAVTVPAGKSSDGMPIGVQLVAAPNDDRCLISVMRELDAGLHGTEGADY